MSILNFQNFTKCIYLKCITFLDISDAFSTSYDIHDNHAMIKFKEKDNKKIIIQLVNIEIYFNKDKIIIDLGGYNINNKFLEDFKSMINTNFGVIFNMEKIEHSKELITNYFTYVF